MRRIALCVIATGKYGCFVPDLLASARAFFVHGHDVRFLLFSDGLSDDVRDAISTIHIPHRGWPGATLFRYHAMLLAEADLRVCDYAFYCDADMRFAGPVGDEILGCGLTAVRHPGFDGRPRSTFPYEKRRESRAYVSPSAGISYYAGGFQGGRISEWIEAMETMQHNIDLDMKRSITACWHDESHWNHYLVESPPAVSLSPDYCCPETCQRPGRRLLALDKNHAEIRG